MKKRILTLVFSVLAFGLAFTGCSQENRLSLSDGYYKFSRADKASNSTTIRPIAMSVNAFLENDYHDRLAPHFEHEALKNVEFQLNGQPVSLREYMENAYEEAVWNNPFRTLERYLQFEYDFRFVTMLGHDLTVFLQGRHPELDLNYDKTLWAVEEAFPYSWRASEWRDTNWNTTNPDMVYINTQQEEWINDEIASANSLSETEKNEIRVSIEQFFSGIDDMSAYVRETSRWHTRRKLIQFGYEADLSGMTSKELIIIRSLYSQILPLANTVFEVKDDEITIHSQIWFDMYWDFDTFSLLHESKLYLPYQSSHYTFDLHEPTTTWNEFDPIEICTVNLYTEEGPVQDWLPSISVYNGQIIRFVDWLIPGHGAEFQTFKMVWSLQ
jgi:hypothetical protein